LHFIYIIALSSQIDYTIHTFAINNMADIIITMFEKVAVCSNVTIPIFTF